MDEKSRTSVDSAHAAIAQVITVSDRSARGEREDLSGPRVVERLREHGFEATLRVVPDGADSVSVAIRTAMDDGAKIIITSGGTGVGPRDLTPEGTAPLLTREIPGISEELRRVGASNTPHALLSRGLAGVVGSTFVVNLPGSVKAVDEGMDVLLPILPHLFDQLGGGDH